MATVDYGALLRVDGNFINKDVSLFSPVDTGFVCEKAFDLNGDSVNIKDNYFIYAGDEHLLLAFYKNMLSVICNDKIIANIYNSPFISQTLYINGVDINVRHLDPVLYSAPFSDANQTWPEYVKGLWCGATGTEPLNELENGKKFYLNFLRFKKRIAREHNTLYHYRSARWLCSWEYNGHSYEVIYGYGVEPMENVWNRIKHGDNGYDFSDSEISLINSWFTSDGKGKI